MDTTRAEPAGYLAAIPSPDGLIQLISSGIHYRFNVAWLRAASPATGPPSGV
jgi:sulfatase modifying factor 1